MTRPTDPSHPNARQRMVCLLPEDGIVDALAIDLAVRGVRPVALTATERRIAAALILATGGTANTIARRLRMSYDTARALIDQITTGRGTDAA